MVISASDARTVKMLALTQEYINVSAKIAIGVFGETDPREQRERSVSGVLDLCP